MPVVLHGLIPATAAGIQHKPILASYDSGFECSPEHWIEVNELVEEEIQPAWNPDGEAAAWNRLHQA